MLETQSTLEGRACPFCNEDPDENEYWIKVAQLRTSKLCLAQNQTYRGTCMLIATVGHHVTSLDELEPAEFTSYTLELREAIAAVRRVFRPDHLNVEFLGNVEPHLHAHIIPRFRDDPRWGRPIWMNTIREMPRTKLPRETMRSYTVKLAEALVR